MNLLVLGANSDSAKAVARKFAAGEHADLCLASRDMETLLLTATDLEIRYGVKARSLFFDATDCDSHRPFYDSLDPRPDGVILAFGSLGNQKDAQADFQEARRIIDINYVGAVSILEIVAADFETRGHGFIIALSSVAGERGRQSNYIYGSAKGALTVYLSGLRNRMAKRSVRVMTVLPGFVRTKMTDGLDLPDRLTATPEQVADDVYRAYRSRIDILYTRWFWRWIMLVIKAIPETVFKRLRL
jgi:decaprenylphospho-beta-D-erythro-pentofuranosid-2-ulose 2-reductase